MSEELSQSELMEACGGKSAGAGTFEGAGFTLSFQKTWNRPLAGGSFQIRDNGQGAGGGILPPQGPSDQAKIVLL